MTAESPLVNEAEQFATQWIVQCIEGNRLFHNLAHTQSVVRNCVRLAQLELCSFEEIETLLVSAWFHDTGYLAGSPGHEQESARIALSFLKQHRRSGDFVQSVCDLILATRIPTAPKGLLQEILCDADMSHLGAVEYERCELLLRHELEASEGIVMSDQDWLKKNIDFFEHHNYYTKHARLLWNEQKHINLKRLLCSAAVS